MCFFSKNKSVLKDLIPDNHVDIHSHLLPGIDGARTLEDSLRLSKLYIIWGNPNYNTPHVIEHVWDNTEEQILVLEKIRCTFNTN
jgi:tyrosine-protein phosphatase YwqE